MSNPLFPVTPSTLVKQLKHVLRSKLVPIVKSAPGVGKSSVIQQLADDAGLEVIDVRLSQVDSPELNGYPDLKGDIARYVPFDIFPTTNTTVPAGKKGWLLFLDEATSAPRHVLAAAYKLVLDRKVGPHSLHPNCFIVLAGNRKEDRAITVEMGSAMQSRLIHFDLQSSLKDWSNWASNAGIDSRVIGFLNFAPNMLNQFNPDLVGETYACERTWEFLSRIVTGQSQADLEDLLPAMAGAVGPGAMTEFMNFVRIFSTLPTLSQIQADPLAAALPADPGARFAMAVHLVEHVDVHNAKTLLVYLARLQVEAQAVAMRLIKARKPEVVKTPECGKIFIAIAQYL